MAEAAAVRAAGACDSDPSVVAFPRVNVIMSAACSGSGSGSLLRPVPVGLGHIGFQQTAQQRGQPLAANQPASQV